MKKKILLILIPIIVLLVIGAVLVVLYFTTDLFKSPSELFWKYFAQAESAMNILENDNWTSQNSLKANNSYTSNGQLALTISQGENSSKILNIETTARHDANNGRTYADATLKNGDIDLFQVSYINSGDVYAVRCADVLENYIGIRNSGLKALAMQYGLDAQNIPDSIDFNGFLNTELITEEQKNHIVNTYLPIINNNLEDSQYTKTSEQVTVFNNLIEADKYSVNITGENLKQILVEMLNTLKTDTETLTIINGSLLSSYYDAGVISRNDTNLAQDTASQSETTYDINSSYSNSTANSQNITQVIDQLVEQINQDTIEENVTIDVYVSEGKTVKVNMNFDNIFEATYDVLDNSEEITINIVTTSVLLNSSQTTSIVLSKTTANGVTTNRIEYIPDASYADSRIELEMNLAPTGNNSMSNSYRFSILYGDGGIKQNIQMNYTTNTSVVPQVEEIMELTNSNTVIANNYAPEEFTTFLNNWGAMVNSEFTEKMNTIGFSDIKLNLTEELIDRADEAEQYYANDEVYTDEMISNVEDYIDGLVGE